MTAEDYLNRVSVALRDLPWKLRRELVSELRGHLDELPAGPGLGEQLGTPEQYAADLRSAAGLERRRGPIAFLRARRPRNLVLTVFALTVVALAIGAVAWIQSYQPLAFDHEGIDPIGVVEVPGGDSEYVVFHQGRPFQFGIRVRSTGRFTIRVLGVSYPPGLPFSGRLMMGRYDYSARLLAPYTTFHPFDLRPGRSRLLIFEGVYACSAHGGNTGVVLQTFPVRYRFLWRTGTANIRLPYQLAIVFPKGFRCR